MFQIVGNRRSNPFRIGTGHVSITHDRYQVVDYSIPTYLVEYSHFALKPKVLDPFENIVMPFQNSVWMITAATVVLMGSCLLIIYRVYDTLSEDDLLPFPLLTIKNPADFILLPLSMLVQQDRLKWFKFAYKTSAGSMTVLLWSLGGLVLMLSYVSNLRASLIAIAYEKPVDTVQDILDRDEDLWYISGTSLLDNLKNSAREDIRQLHEQVLRKNTFYNYTFGLPLKEMNIMIETGQGQLIAHQDAARFQMGDINKVYGEVPFRMMKVFRLA